MSEIIRDVKEALIKLAEAPLEKNKVSDEVLKFLIENSLATKFDDTLILTKRGETALWYLTDVKEESFLSTELENFLTFLEKLEETYINLGNYDVITFPEDLAHRLGENINTVRTYLEELANKGYIMRIKCKVKNDYKIGYRSRIAEIVRLIAKVKQRFWNTRLEEAPNLVSTVKLRVIDRYVSRRDIPVEGDPLEDIKLYLKNYIEDYDDIIEALKAWLNKFGIKRLSGFQYRTIVKILSDYKDLSINPRLKEKNIVLVAETGAGKTEAYFIPLVLQTIIGKLVGNAPKIGTIIVYPRISLALNQTYRFTSYLYELNQHLKNSNKLVLGLDIGYVPRDIETLELDLKGITEFDFRKSWERIDEEIFIFKPLNCPVIIGKDDLKYRCMRSIFYDKRKKSFLCDEGHTLPLWLFKKQAWEADFILMHPDILLRRLSEDYLRNYILTHDIITLVLDEVHLYSHIPGSHMTVIIRRLRNIVKKLNKQLYIITLSATIPSPDSFIKTLTGLNVKQEDIITVDEEELSRVSVDYYIFVKPETVSLVNIEEEENENTETVDLKYLQPLSTMIQTLMVVMHNMKRTALKFKGMGFVDSIDTLIRWYRAQRDAEVKELFKIRVIGCKDCTKCTDQYANGECHIFQSGEMWYFTKFDKKSKSLGEKLKIDYYYSGRRGKLENVDVILATSALEVGFDDPSAIAFFQYKAPKSPISFVQRKGRVARSHEDRPISVIVLPPYSRMDIFTFQNEDYLINAKYNELPITDSNYFVQRAHTTATILDYLSVIHHIGISYSEKIGEEKIEKIIELINNSEELDNLRKWLQKAIPIFSQNYLFKRVLEYIEKKLEGV